MSRFRGWTATDYWMVGVSLAVVVGCSLWGLAHVVAFLDAPL